MIELSRVYCRTNKPGNSGEGKGGKGGGNGEGKVINPPQVSETPKGGKSDKGTGGKLLDNHGVSDHL